MQILTLPAMCMTRDEVLSGVCECKRESKGDRTRERARERERERERERVKRDLPAEILECVIGDVIGCST